MVLTNALRDYVRKQFGLAATATDDEIKATINAKLMSGDLLFGQVAELQAKADGATGDKPDAKALIGDAVGAAMATHMAPLVKGLEKLLERVSTPAPAVAPLVPTGTGTDGAKQMEGDAAKMLADAQAKTAAEEQEREKSFQVRVKSAVERYDGSTKRAVYPAFTRAGTKGFNAGAPASYCGRPLMEPSELNKALAGAYFKWSLQGQLKSEPDMPRWVRMTEHDKELMEYALRECEWTGHLKCGPDVGQSLNQLDGVGYKVHRQKLSEQMRKDLLDDGTSGGTNAVPVFFDDMIVLTPVLYGELWPLVDMVNISRGRLIDGASMSNPTFTSGTAEGTAITPFSTSGFIAAMDSTIYPVVSAVNIGLDFESDTPADIGGILIQKFGEKLQEWGDNQIANGDGTTEMQGFFNASSTTTVLAANGGSGPPSVGDYEALLFGMNKAFRRAVGGRCVFVSNDTTYSRARGIAVGPNDERRVFGMSHEDYTILNRPHKVQNDIDNNKLAFVNMGGYRLYRRLGMTVRVETTGKTLALANEKCIVVRGRFGGRLTLGGYASIITNGQS